MRWRRSRAIWIGPNRRCVALKGGDAVNDFFMRRASRSRRRTRCAGSPNDGRRRASLPSFVEKTSGCARSAILLKSRGHLLRQGERVKAAFVAAQEVALLWERCAECWVWHGAVSARGGSA